MRRPRPTYAFVVSTLAVVVAVAGTSVAATRKPPAPSITGAHVKANTLQGIDVKNGTVESKHVDSATRRALKVTGPKGPDGAIGPAGPIGAQGDQGDKGVPARNAFAWAYNIQPNILRDNSQNNGPTPEDWYGMAGTGGWTNPDAGYSGTLLQLADGQNDGLLKLEYSSDVVATAHLTGWHEDATVHSRLECRLRITNAATNSQATMGQPVIFSSDVFRQVTTIGLVGGIQREPGTYGVHAECRDLDLHTVNYQKWYIAKGNLSVLSAKAWR